MGIAAIDAIEKQRLSSATAKGTDMSDWSIAKHIGGVTNSNLATDQGMLGANPVIAAGCVSDPHANKFM